MKDNTLKKTENIEAAEKVKRIIIRSVYSNDDLFDRLVLKGGNAIALVHNKKTRNSIDVDFSITNDYPGGLDKLGENLSKSLTQGFNESGYNLFDFKIKETPKILTGEMKNFWGGYSVDFKIIDLRKSMNFEREIKEKNELLEILRRNALSIHGSTKIEIDISKYENVSNKISKEIDGVTVYAYSVEMIVAEKLRALCQQHINYGEIVQRNRPGSPRPRDFFDIHLLMTEYNIDLLIKDNLLLIEEMFKIKRVPLELLNCLSDQKDFHGANFSAVKASLKIDSSPERDFDFYFNFVKDLAEKIHNALG